MCVHLTPWDNMTCRVNAKATRNVHSTHHSNHIHLSHILSCSGTPGVLSSISPAPPCALQVCSLARWTPRTAASGHLIQKDTFLGPFFSLSAVSEDCVSCMRALSVLFVDLPALSEPVKCKCFV